MLSKSVSQDMMVLKRRLLDLPGDSGLEIGRKRTPSLRILQFIHTLQQQGPFIHTDPLSLCEWRAECTKVCQLLSQKAKDGELFSCSDQVSMRRQDQLIGSDTALRKRDAGFMAPSDEAMTTFMLTVSFLFRQENRQIFL